MSLKNGPKLSEMAKKAQFMREKKKFYLHQLIKPIDLDLLYNHAAEFIQYRSLGGYVVCTLQKQAQIGKN